LITTFESRGARPAHFPPRGISADRSRNTRSAARTWRSCVVGQHGARSSPRRRPGLARINTTTSQRHELRAFLTTAFKSRAAHPARFPSRGVSADRPRSTHRAAWTWRGCAVGQRGARSSPRRRPGIDRINTAPGQRHGLREVQIAVFESRAARPARVSPRVISADCPRSTCRAVRTWRGCVAGQRGARSSSRRRPGLERTNTVIGRRHELR